jgi:RNA polymerase sigma-70 factor (ECF subfamily)
VWVEHGAEPQPLVGGPLNDDRRLVEAVLAKDRKATAEFVNRYTSSVYNYLRARLWPRHDLVDDLVQDVFIAAWQRLGSFRAESPLRGWLLGIARHKVEDHYRATLRHVQMPVDDVSEEMLSETLRLDEALDRARIEQRMRTVLAALPPGYGAVLLWRYWEKRSLREMAESTGRTEKAMERLLARAREQFRKRWNENA